MGQVQAEFNDEDLDLRLLMTRLAVELQDGAKQLTALQWSISTLLEKVHHPDLAEEIHMLQDIDRIQQNLADVASVIDTAATQPSPVMVARAPICAAIHLESLRARLHLAAPAGHPGANNDPDDAEITWL
ncbi:MAG TPA: hypothetical protein ENK83_07470 [Aliiroseovarius sp.]|nr:hypothetical protein [Aliiroseovarius sp.]